jgi:hypothetical protein
MQSHRHRCSHQQLHAARSRRRLRRCHRCSHHKLQATGSPILGRRLRLWRHLCSHRKLQAAGSPILGRRLRLWRHLCSHRKLQAASYPSQDLPEQVPIAGPSLPHLRHHLIRLTKARRGETRY